MSTTETKQSGAVKSARPNAARLKWPNARKFLGLLLAAALVAPVAAPQLGLADPTDDDSTGGATGNRTITVTKVWEGDEGFEALRKAPDIHLSPLDGYTQLEWIQSGTTRVNAQWIDTGYKLTSESRIIADFQYEDYSTTSGYRFTGDQTTWGSFFRFGTLAGSGGTKDDPSGRNKVGMFYYVRFGDQEKRVHVDNLGGVDILTARNRVELDKSGFKINDSTFFDTDFASLPLFVTTNNAYVFAINTSNTTQDNSPAKLWSYKILEDNRLVRDYIPVRRNSDNEVGLYDLCERKFYQSANGGNFTAGPEVQSSDSRLYDLKTNPKYKSDDTQWRENGNVWTYTFKVPDDDTVYEVYEANAGSLGYYTCADNSVLVKTEELDGQSTPQPIIAYGSDKNTATIANTMQQHTLTVRKSVTGSEDNKAQYSSFDVTVNVEGFTGAVEIKGASAPGDGKTNPNEITVANGTGTAKVWLKNGDSFSIALPEGATYTVSEPDEENFTETYQINGDDPVQGCIVSERSLTADTTIAFDNQELKDVTVTKE